MKKHTKDIIKLLKKYDWNNLPVYGHFEEFELFFSDIESFRRSVRKINQEYNPEYKKKKNSYEKLASKNRMLESENKKLKKENNKYNDRLFKSDLIVESLLKSIDDIELPLYDIDTIRYTSNENIKNIFLLGDTHYGEVVYPETINNINSYNKEVSTKRIYKAFKENLDNAIINGATECYILMLGDMLSGIIHDELESSNFDTITNLLMDFATMCAGFLKTYAKSFTKVYVKCVVGNHGRLQKNIRFKKKSENNFEYMFYRFMKAMVEDIKNIEVDVPKSTSVVTKIGNMNWLVAHGDNVRGGNNIAGYPFSTLSRDTLKQNFNFAMANQNFDHCAIGHFHKYAHFTLLDGTKMYMNGSVIGGNEFSINALNASYPASQTSLITNNDFVLSSKEIFLNDIMD